MIFSDSHLAILERFGEAVRVLELGSGEMSTKRFLDRAFFPRLSSLTVIEDDPEWAARIPMDPRVEAVYSGSIGHFLREQPQSFWAFDLIFIDNSRTVTERVEAIKAVVDAKPLGVVVIHDFDCPSYREAAKFASVTVHDALRPWTAVCRA